MKGSEYPIRVLEQILKKNKRTLKSNTPEYIDFTGRDELSFQVCHVRVLVGKLVLDPRHPHGIDDRGVVQLVADDNVLFA